jgi:class 3 adenylate cyclase
LPNKGYTLFPVKQNELLVPFLGIQEDERGNLWLHSTYDIYHFDTQTKAYTHLHSSLVTTNHAANSQSYLDPETGIFYVTSNEGVWMVDTRLFYNDQKLKKITISDFFINYESLESIPVINPNKDLFLSYNQNSFSIYFSNFDYEQNKNYALEYKLVGASLNWTPAPKSQILDFNNLDPGNYTLIIKYKNFPETHNTTLTLNIHISKPWWQTWWFLLGSFLLIAGSIRFYFQQQTKRLKERNVALEQKVNERTQEFQIQKKQAEDLLLNILPADIVTELKTKGATEARSHENISVLFTDFVNFTGISAKLSPADLVQEIDRSFKAFDQIMDKHGIEKIKTIGDSYMAVGGLNKNPLEGALATIHAALDIIEFVQNNDCLFEIRIGINTGPVIAGVVGHKKFAYDIWGSTVNIASRMESNGIPMRINISQSTYLQVKDYIHCTYRGQVEVKNMGAMEMYLVD